MFSSTDSQYGVNEVLLSSVLGAVVFSILAAQPLVIVGVTGRRPPPAAVFSRLTPRQVPLLYSTSKPSHSPAGRRHHLHGPDSTVYDIMKPGGTNYMAFMCWIGM